MEAPPQTKTVTKMDSITPSYSMNEDVYESVQWAITLPLQPRHCEYC
jgi:hypothetical protein